MDQRRLSTGEVLAAGVLDKPAPDAGIPDDRESFRFDVEEPCSNAELIEALDRGAVSECCEYYGIPVVWKEGDTYRGVLLQYRSVTEDKTFATAEECVEWYRETAYAVAG